MALTTSMPHEFKRLILGGSLDPNADDIHICLMRPYVNASKFNADTWRLKKNFIGNSGVIASLTFANAGNTMTRALGNFVTDGFVIGNRITTNAAAGANQGPFFITDVQITALTVTDETGADPALTDVGDTNVTVTQANELATALGYTADTKVLVYSTETESDTSDYGSVEFATVSWLAAGGSIVSPAAILYNDTLANDPIMAFMDFDGNQTATDTFTFTIAGITIKVS